MKYSDFERLIREHRPDVAVVGKHGDFCNNRSNNTLGITFRREDGSTSKVYDYHGSYAEVLASLGIYTYNQGDVYIYQMEIDRCKECIEHPEDDFFWKLRFSTIEEYVKYKKEELKKLEQKFENMKATCIFVN